MSLKVDTSLPADLKSLYQPETYASGKQQKQASTRIIKGWGNQIKEFINFPKNDMLFTQNLKTALHVIVDKINFLIYELGYKKETRENFCENLNSAKDKFNKNITTLKDTDALFSNEITTSQIEKDQKIKNKIINFKQIIFGSEAKNNPSNNTNNTNSKKVAKNSATEKSLKSNKSKSPNTKNKPFQDKKEQFQSLFNRSIEEFKRLDKKIQDYKKLANPDNQTVKDIAYKARKSIPAYILEGALAASKEKDIARQANFDNLKNILKESQLSCNDVEILGNKIKWLETIMPQLNENSEQLNKLSKTATSLMELFEKLHIDKIFADFLEKINDTERDTQKLLEKTSHFDNLALQFEGYKKDAQKMNDLELKLTKIEAFGKDIFAPVLDKTLTEITTAINYTNGLEYKDLIDEDFITEMNKQKKTALETYERVRKDITEKSNNFFLELNNLKQQIAIFNKLINLSANVTQTYIKAEKACQRLRYTRLKITDQDIHAKAFEHHVKILNDIHNIISKQTIDDFYTSTSEKWENTVLTQDDFKASVFHEKKVKSSPSLKDQIIELNGEKFNIFLAPTRQSAKEIGLQGKDEDKIKLFDNHNKLLEKQLDGYKNNLKDAYTRILRDVCKYATDEVNAMGKTLATFPTGYENRFPDAYTAKNPVGKKLQEVGTTIVKYAYGETINPYTPIESPFVSLNDKT